MHAGGKPKKTWRQWKQPSEAEKQPSQIQQQLIEAFERQQRYCPEGALGPQSKSFYQSGCCVRACQAYGQPNGLLWLRRRGAHINESYRAH